MVLCSALFLHGCLQRNAALLGAAHPEPGVHLLFAWGEPTALLTWQHHAHCCWPLAVCACLLLRLSNHWVPESFLRNWLGIMTDFVEFEGNFRILFIP